MITKESQTSGYSNVEELRMPRKDTYNFSEREKVWQNFWAQEGIYDFDPHSSRELFVIDTPPPTVSGRLHIGHVFSYTQAEIIARHMRMRGREVRYPFGVDNNGLPTERLVEAELGVRAEATALKAFIVDCQEITDRYAKLYEDLLRSIGFSMDWRLEYSTISQEVQRISQTAFLHLYERGKVYRSESPALYCPECKTSIAQAEIDKNEVLIDRYEIPFTLSDGGQLVVSTDRPELLPTCVAIFVNPDDERYQNLIGMNAVSPLGKTVSVMTDADANPNVGNGLFLCCTYANEQDMKWVKRYRLEETIIIGHDGLINNTTESLGINGLDVVSARQRFVEYLLSRNLVVQNDQIKAQVDVHERCGTPIEIIPSHQWFMKILEMKGELIQAADKVNWYPTSMKKRFVDWVNSLKWDWCISRERFYGIPIPTFVCKKCEAVSLPPQSDLPVNPTVDILDLVCKSCGGTEFGSEALVFDTWFTSSLTPEINNFNPLNEQLAGKMLPMSMRAQAHDIIRSWTVYTMLMSLYLRGEVPWHDLMISGHVLLMDGQKVSKKTGGSNFRPDDLVSKNSADAVRYAMCGASLGQDAYFDMARVKEGKKLVTKLFNAGKFALANLHDFDPTTSVSAESIEAFDGWILNQMTTTAALMTKEFDRYEFSKALFIFERFFWDDFTDNYLEIVKGRLYNSAGQFTEQERLSAQYTMYHVFLGILKMAAPFMPHITEELFHSEFVKTATDVFSGFIESDGSKGLFAQSEISPSIHKTSWPDKEFVNKDEVIDPNLATRVIHEVRKCKSQNQLKLSASLRCITIKADQTQLDSIKVFIKDLKFVTRAQEILLVPIDSPILELSILIL